jgi:hypothetical protein
MESNDITEGASVSELLISSSDKDDSDLLSDSCSSPSTSSSSESSSGSMETSDDDSMSLSSSEVDNDSSSDFYSTTPESSEDEDHYVSETKKRKRNPLDSFCLYTIKPNNPNDTNLYIGSTINFNRRKLQHKKAVNNKRGGSYYCILYRYIRKCGGWDNFTMEKILDFPCETKQEGLLKEKEYILKHNATLNSIMPISEST